MISSLRAMPTVSEEQARRSLRYLAWERLFAGAMFSLGSGGFMAAYALALGANNLQVGVLAALPFIAQVIRLPAILLVERYRARKALAVPTLLASQLIWIPIGAVPLFIDTPGAAAVGIVIALLAMRGLFSPLWVTSSTSWIRDLVPAGRLGSYFGRRQSLSMFGAAVAGLGGSVFVEWWQGQAAPGDEILAYSFLLIAGVLSLGLLSPFLASRAVEPLMSAAEQSDRSALAILREPLRDRNFQHLIRFLFAWSLTSNLAVPFFAVYMLTVLDLSLPFVVGMTVLGQASSVLFVRVWGPLADRTGSKTVLSLSASLWLFVIIGWVFTSPPGENVAMYPLLAALHVFGGVAAAGVNLTVNTLALNVAPEGKTVPYSGVAGIAHSVGAGLGPILGGLLADFFLLRSLGFNIVWESPTGAAALPALSLTGFGFLFVMAFVLGLLSLNLLVPLREEGETPRDVALAELMGGAGPLSRAVSSMPVINVVSELSYGYLKRVPGADVALGVTAYQLAASTQAATSSALRGRSAAQDVAQRVGAVVSDAVGEVQDIAGAGSQLARHATRGAVLAVGDLGGQLGNVARGAVLGTLHTLMDERADPEAALHWAAYGVIQGAIEADRDIAVAARAAIEAARDAAPELGVGEDEATAAAAEGIVAAARASGDPVPAEVIEALPDGDARSS